MLQQVDTNLWSATYPLKVMGMKLGARMTVVRLSSGGLFVHAPITLDAALRAELDVLGPVYAVVAPNSMHHLYLGACLAAYPQARGFAAAGAAAKHPELQLRALTGTPEPLWAAELEQHAIAGAPGLAEVAFFHRSSRTLILTDWLFNFSTSPSWLMGLYLRLCGGLGRPVQTPVLRKLIKDRAAALASTEALLAWDFERVIVSHAEIIERGGKEALREATAWLRS